MREREIIRRYFSFAAGACGVDVGVGDDAAVLTPPPSTKLSVSTDTLNSGVHFLPTVEPYFLARKAAAVSLSDMAAMGALPLWMTVSLSSPPAAAAWFESFAQGLQASTEEYRYTIIGGDLTSAEALSVTTTIIGSLSGAPLLRSGAKVGDGIWLSGRLGGAAHALGVLLGTLPAAEQMADSNRCLQDPSPRLALGAELVGLASAAMDLSDGLLTAAQTLAEMSGVRLQIAVDTLPAAASLSALDKQSQHQCLLTGGDDYELLFTLPAATPIAALADKTPICQVGVVTEGSGVQLMLHGEEIPPVVGGYEHDFDE